MSFRRMLAWLTFLALFAMALRASVASDTWWHLRAGEWMLDNRQLLSSDHFSHTRLGEPWRYPGWLAQLVMIGIYRWQALPGLNVMTALAVVAAFGFVWRSMRQPPLLKAFVLVLGASVSGVFWSARPQILTLMMTGAFFWSLQRAQRNGPRALWLPPLLMALWVNLHGGFAVGFILLGIELLASLLDHYLPRRLRITELEVGRLQPAHILLAIGLCLLAVSLNPYGPRMLAYPLQTVSIQTLRNHIQEWQSPDFHQLELQPFLLMLLLTGGAMAVSPRRPSWKALLTVGAFAALGLSAARNVALFGLLATPYLARYAQAVLAGRLPVSRANRQVPERVARMINLGLVLLVAIAAALKAIQPLTPAVNRAAVEGQSPVAAVEYLLENQPPGPLFNSYNWGSYLMWAAYPDYLTFVDGRTDLFNDEVLEQYLSIWRAEPGWEQQLESWGVRLALIEPEAPLAARLSTNGWITLYQDDMAIVLASQEP